jgi:hypothetical protein
MNKGFKCICKIVELKNNGKEITNRISSSEVSHDYECYSKSDISLSESTFSLMNIKYNTGYFCRWNLTNLSLVYDLSSNIANENKDYFEYIYTEEIDGLTDKFSEVLLKENKINNFYTTSRHDFLDSVVDNLYYENKKLNSLIKFTEKAILDTNDKRSCDYTNLHDKTKKILDELNKLTEKCPLQQNSSFKIQDDYYYSNIS